MDTNFPLAPDNAAPYSAPETRSARGPAIHTRAPSPSDLTREVRQQTEAITRATRMVSQSEGMRRLNNIKQRAVANLRQVAEGPRTPRAQKRHAADPLVQQHVARINGDLDHINEREVETLRRENAQLRRTVARPPLTRGANGGARDQNAASGIRALHRAATDHYLRTGETHYRGHTLSDLERQAAPYGRIAFGGSNPDGGFLVLPTQSTGPLEKLLEERVEMRQHCNVVTINSSNYQEHVQTSSGGAAWGDELTAPSETDTPKFSLLDIPSADLYAQPRVSTNLLQDASINIEQLIADGVIDQFSVKEAQGFTSGNGVVKPYGFLGYGSSAYVTDASWAWGKVGFIATGASGAFPTPSGSVGSADPLIQAEYALKAEYAQQAKYMMNRKTIGVARILKDVEGRYVWSEGNAVTGQPALLNNREVIQNSQMPDIAADSFSVALADWKRFYTIVDRSGITVLRDPYTAKPAVIFFTTKRVGGAIRNFEAGKLIKFA